MEESSIKLTVKEVQERVKEILARRSVTCGKSSWIDPEGVQGLIDDLRTDVIQAIADGSKVPYALTRCIAELPRVHYGTIPSEPARTTVEKVAASFARSFNKSNATLPTQSHDDEVALVERYQQCVSALLSMFESDPLGDSPAHFYIERLEALIERKLIGPVQPTFAGQVLEFTQATNVAVRGLQYTLTDAEIKMCEELGVSNAEIRSSWFSPK